MATATKGWLAIEDKKWPQQLEKGIRCKMEGLNLLKYSECTSRSYLCDSKVNAWCLHDILWSHDNLWQLQTTECFLLDYPSLYGEISHA